MCCDVAVQFKVKTTTHCVDLYGKKREVKAFSRTVMIKTLKCKVRLVWFFRKTQWIALFFYRLEAIGGTNH